MNLSLLMAVSKQSHFNSFTVHTCYNFYNKNMNIAFTFLWAKNTFILGGSIMIFCQKEGKKKD